MNVLHCNVTTLHLFHDANKPYKSDLALRRRSRKGWKRIRTDTDLNISNIYLPNFFSFSSFRTEADRICTDTVSDILDIIYFSVYFPFPERTTCSATTPHP